VAARIAGYEIKKRLGGGAWGTSFHAVQVSLERPVRITVLPPREKAPEIHERAKAYASLTHPHLVSGIDFGELKGRQYLVTEWVEGTTIGEVVRRGGAVAEDRALEIALAAAAALEHASLAGFVHDRLGPEAVIVARGGNPKLRGMGPDLNLVPEQAEFRAPEQKQGAAIDVRANIWSLGAVVYFMLTARHPFEEAPPAEVIDGKVVESHLPLIQATRKLQPETYELVERMMALEPGNRFDTASALGESIESAIGRIEERVTFRPSKPARPERPTARKPRGARPRRRPRRR